MDNKKACITCSREFPTDEAVCPDDGTILTPIVKDRYLGTILAGRYEIQQVIGGGGMGLVYKARHVMMNRIVAIKMLHHHLTNSPEALKRFQLEAQAASCLSLPNILTIYDFGVSDEGQPFMVMDYLEGTSLADVLDQEKRLSVQRSLNIFIQCCAGLAHAHQKGVLHRDLKPSNIMLVNYGEDQADFVKIVDFGIAKLLNRTDGASANLTRTGEVYGSPLYMSPEQCRGQELDARSDLYSFGCVMYKTLTGLPIFNGSEVIELLFKQVSEMPEPFSKVAPDAYIPADLEAIVFKSLAKSADQRYNSMSELKDVLEAYKRKLEGDELPATASSTNNAPVQSSIRLSSKFVGHAAAPPLSKDDVAKLSEIKMASAPSALSSSSDLRSVAKSTTELPLTASSAGRGPAVPAAASASPPVPTREVAQAAPPTVRHQQPVAAPAGTPAGAEMAEPFERNPKVAEPAVHSSRPIKPTGKTKPDWLLVIEGTFANRLVLASVAGLIMATATVAYMAVTAEKAHHITHPTPDAVSTSGGGNTQSDPDSDPNGDSDAQHTKADANETKSNAHETKASAHEGTATNDASVKSGNPTKTGAGSDVATTSAARSDKSASTGKSVVTTQSPASRGSPKQVETLQTSDVSDSHAGTPADPESSTPGKKASRRTPRHAASHVQGHRVRRHAYSSYGY